MKQKAFSKSMMKQKANKKHDENTKSKQKV